jgi:hypothetical protein
MTDNDADSRCRVAHGRLSYKWSGREHYFGFPMNDSTLAPDSLASVQKCPLSIQQPLKIYALALVIILFHGLGRAPVTHIAYFIWKDGEPT